MVKAAGVGLCGVIWRQLAIEGWMKNWAALTSGESITHLGTARLGGAEMPAALGIISAEAGWSPTCCSISRVSRSALGLCGRNWHELKNGTDAWGWAGCLQSCKALRTALRAVKSHRSSHPGSVICSMAGCALFCLGLGCSHQTFPLCPERRQRGGNY